MKFRKKPVVIEAMQFNGSVESYIGVIDWARSLGTGTLTADELFRYETNLMLVRTLEGSMAAGPGDWIIRGVKGEFYSCKPDIFEATYDRED